MGSREGAALALTRGPRTSLPANSCPFFQHRSRGPSRLSQAAPGLKMTALT